MIRNWALLLLWAAAVLAVKDYLFKKCDQSGFCARNRLFAANLDQNHDYQPHYAIDPKTVTVADKQLTAVVLKQLNDGSIVDLELKLEVIGLDSLRLRIDEATRDINNDIRINAKRYDEASKWAFTQEPELQPVEYILSNEAVGLIYGNDSEYSATVQFYPFKVTVAMNGIPQLVVNNRNLFNLEHYRSRESQQDPESIDVFPEESRFNAYNDDFPDSKADTLPLGPESVALDFTFVNYTNVYGIPEHADSLSLKDTTNNEPYRLFNVDIFEYDVQSKLPMYGSIPFMVAVNSKSAAGVFWINSADTYVDIKKNTHKSDDRSIVHSINTVDTHWMSENGIIDVVLMVKPTARDINKAYGALTGFTTLPNLFSVGYHQCRWNYNDEEDVMSVHAGFDEHGIPYDTLWLDIEYTDDKKYFTWDPKQFPDPDAMMAKMDATGRNLVVIVDPHLKTGYEVSDDVIELGIGIKNAHNLETYRGHCWPGESVWIDTLNPDAQHYWDSLFFNETALLGKAINGHLWNDMNEPSIFNGPETTSPKDLVHYGNWEHRSVHNLYGLTFHEATYNALTSRNPNSRPFILTRAFFAGSQRTAAMWTGDNMARWEYLKESIPMVLTMNVAGFPFAGADVGGFFGNPSKELLTRWYQTGIWYPFFRAHAHIDSARREPWIAGGEYTAAMRNAIKLRYRLLSVMYTEFWKSSQTGSPIVAPLVWNVPQDPKVFDIDDEFYLGGLLVKPVTEEGATSVQVYFPCDGAEYYDFFDLRTKYESCQTVEIDVELKDIPVFVKSGTILATKDTSRRSTRLMKNDPYTLHVVLDANGKASGDLYIDDGETFNYLHDDWVHVEFEANDTERTITGVVTHIINTPFANSLDSVTINKIVITGSSQTPKDVASINGTPETAQIIADASVFTVRNPRLPINKPWTVSY